MAGKPTISLNVRISPAHSAVLTALLDRPDTVWIRKNQLVEAAIEELGRSHGVALQNDASAGTGPRTNSMVATAPTKR